jgi:hypothetical protein
MNIDYIAQTARAHGISYMILYHENYHVAQDLSHALPEAQVHHVSDRIIVDYNPQVVISVDLDQYQVGSLYNSTATWLFLNDPGVEPELHANSRVLRGNVFEFLHPLEQEPRKNGTYSSEWQELPVTILLDQQYPELELSRETKEKLEKHALCVSANPATPWHLVHASIAEYVANIKRDIVDKRALFLWNADEIMETILLYRTQTIVDILRRDGVTTDIYYLTADLDAQRVYDEFCERHNIKHRMHMVSGVNAMYHLARQNDPAKDLTPKIKPHMFLFYSARPRIQRILTMGMLLEYGMVDMGLVSFHLDSMGHLDYYLTPQPHLRLYDKHTQETYETLQRYAQQIEQNQSTFPRILDIADHSTAYERNLVTDTTVAHSQQTYFSIVSETFCIDNPDDMFLAPCAGGEPHMDGYGFTEKTFRPLACYHPFVLIGRANMLKRLRALGFKTFSPWIDESYDTVVDDTQRMLAAHAEIRRLASLSHDSWLEIQHLLAPVLKHNLDRIMDPGFIPARNPDPDTINSIIKQIIAPENSHE